jgi:exonuclease SbcD
MIARHATMLRILHTADWHLGAGTYGFSRDEDHRRFLEWLAETLVARNIDALVVAGDVFDQAHPPADAQKLYFDFLQRIARTAVRHVVIVGGNHDSPSRLDAPRELLKYFDVHVVGGLTADPSEWSRCVHPLKNERGEVEASVLAVPFMHEYRLGVRTALASPGAVASQFRERFGGLYARLCDEAIARHDGAPLVATGHLAVNGTDRDDAPKAVHQAAGIGGVAPEVFDERLAYVALGHIHRSHRVGDRPIYYAGSPVAMVARETRSPRVVLEVEIDGKRPARVTPVEVPAPRGLIVLDGPVDDVAEQIRAIDWDTPLPPYVVARVDAERLTQSAQQRLLEAAAVHASRGLRLVKMDPRSSETARARSRCEAPLPSLQQASPEEVFKQLCATRGESVDDALLTAFRSVMQLDDEPS